MVALKYLFFPQALGGELRGECQDFEAVPGQGLRCSVVRVADSVSDTATLDSMTISRHIVIQTTSSLLSQESSAASLPRSYQVKKCLC